MDKDSIENLYEYSTEEFVDVLDINELYFFCRRRRAVLATQAKKIKSLFFKL